MTHICLCSIHMVNFLRCLNDFCFNLLNFRYFFNEKVSEDKKKKGTKNRGTRRDASRERERREVTRMEEKKLAAQVRDSFNSKMQCQKKYFKVLHIVTSVSSKKGFVCQH